MVGLDEILVFEERREDFFAAAAILVRIDADAACPGEMVKAIDTVADALHRDFEEAADGVLRTVGTVADADDALYTRVGQALRDQPRRIGEVVNPGSRRGEVFDHVGVIENSA